MVTTISVLLILTGITVYILSNRDIMDKTENTIDAANKQAEQTEQGINNIFNEWNETETGISN